MAKELSKEKKDKFDKILKDSSIKGEVGKLPKGEFVELKSYAIKKVAKLGKFTKTI